ncbi:MAG TPA: hypothetical protein ENI96_13940 [Sedimenticola thiotaurini]|uniref:Uncharacterized protein n=1 Tax=Sedimenticola thiotaurini TaxID=1543721 RepID=A0A831W4E4_9GAMM|nr:hypothetical protein [Sedimenticola thiotaurini]
MTDEDKDEKTLNRLLYPNPFEEEGEAPFAVDEEGIPILEEVVQPKPEPPPVPEVEQLSDPKERKALDYDALLSTMRAYLKSQLEADMESILQEVVPEAITAASASLEEALRQELARRLEQRTSEVIDRLLEQQLNSRLFS